LEADGYLAVAAMANRGLRWLSQPVEAGQALEVIGLLVAAGVAVEAIYFSSRESRAQLQAMRDQLQTMTGQLNEMQEESRPWVGLAGARLVNKSPEEPLKIALFYQNFGRQPATFVCNNAQASLLPTANVKDIEQSSYTTSYPGDTKHSLEGGISKQFPIRDGGGNETPVSALVDEIVPQQALYIVFGCLTYVSAGKPEFTTFCFMLDPATSNNSAGQRGN
jgi:hypothetical protein